MPQSVGIFQLLSSILSADDNYAAYNTSLSLILCNADHLLMEPDQSILHQLGVDMESGLLNLDKDNCVNVPVCNYNMNAQHFSKGQMVGRLYPVTLTNSDSDVR